MYRILTNTFFVSVPKTSKTVVAKKGRFPAINANVIVPIALLMAEVTFFSHLYCSTTCEIIMHIICIKILVFAYVHVYHVRFTPISQRDDEAVHQIRKK